MTLTNRVSFFHLATLACVLAAFSTALYSLADHYLSRQLDDRARAASNALAAAVEVEADGVEWEPVGRAHAIDFRDGVAWAILADDGRIVDRSSEGSARSSPTDWPESEWRTSRLRVAPERIAAEPVTGKYRALTVAVAVPVAPARDALRALGGGLIGIATVLLLLSGILGRIVCRRALIPVARMAKYAHSMGTQDLGDRLPIPATRDEVADLGAAFNELLSRVQVTFERERRFAGEASHQLRTPLAGLIGQLEVALRRDRPANDYRRTLETTLALAGRLRRVVEALLYLARSPSDSSVPGCESVDVAAIVSQRLAARVDDPRSDDLESVLHAQPPILVRAHPDLLGELLDALIDNALKHSPPSTPITVEIQADSLEVRIEVSDSGIGIGIDDLPHIFTPFYRAHSVRVRGIPGSGLGLAVAQRLALAMNARLEVESVLGEGSRFRLRMKIEADIPGMEASPLATSGFNST